LALFASVVHEVMAANVSTFSDVPPVASLLGLAGTLQGKSSAAYKGNVAETAERVETEALVVGCLRRLAAYVEGKALGDAGGDPAGGVSGPAGSCRVGLDRGRGCAESVVPLTNAARRGVA
jgi:hypothetical protein